MSDKKAIREMEDDLPTITESILMMNPTEKILCLNPYRHVIKHLVLAQNISSTMIDVGCGDGLFLRNFFAKAFKCPNDFRYVGIDLSRRKINFAKKFPKPLDLFDTNFILADAEYLPFKTSVFNVGTGIEVLEHLLNPKALISELVRTLKPDGYLIITTPSVGGTKGDFSACLKRFCLLKQLGTPREHFITVHGKKLPHRDFTLPEVKNILLPSLNLIKIYSFNFKVIYRMFMKFLPHRIVLFVILFFENNASKFPKTWGNNWLIFAKNNRAIS